ncbi:potassium channel family protein [Euzebya tangerina]|uniref:potassium channel family protein n=1 Tax=Euzebya tangerina TaxID=591198 RepID=UPI000E320C71|nr:TrkA family potassium uptake protein [Euzebya tangerina]
MRVIIAGCGRVGSGLASGLDHLGHQVAVIDRNARSFRRLGADFGGRTITGVAFDRETLAQAEVEDADAFVAVTSGDNSNIVSARTARRAFGVRTCVARIYDSRRAAIYERHGITTIATTRWSIDAVLGQILTDAARIETTIGPGEGDVVVISHDLPAHGGPWDVAHFERDGKWSLTAVSRTGQTTIPVPRQLVQAGERVHIAVHRDFLDDVEAALTTLGAETAEGT